MLQLPFQSPEVAIVVLPPNNFALSPCYYYLLQHTNKRQGDGLFCNVITIVPDLLKISHTLTVL